MFLEVEPPTWKCNLYELEDTNISCHSYEEEKITVQSSFTSEDEADHLPPVEDTQELECEESAPDQGQSPSLSDLLDHNNEPVTSQRGSWGLGNTDQSDSWHRTDPRYSRFDEEMSPSPHKTWYSSKSGDSDPEEFFVSPRNSISYGRDGYYDDFCRPGVGQSAMRTLMANVSAMKKKIARFEEDFEASFGYRPSHSDKMKHRDVKKYVAELSRARKELKQMKDNVVDMVSGPSFFPLALLRCQEATCSTPPPCPAPNPLAAGTTSNTLRQVEDLLQEKREAVGRPDDLTVMTISQLLDEKTALQKALLYYESLHGRPCSKEERDLARPLYDRYRQVKRITTRSGLRAKDNVIELPPIMEHEAMDFTLASPRHHSAWHNEENLQPIVPLSEGVLGPQVGGGNSEALGDLHALPLGELKERKKEAREEKKCLRRKLREFEDNFERSNGRKVEREDRGLIMEVVYTDYKHSKAKLRLLEALVAKHEMTRG